MATAQVSDTARSVAGPARQRYARGEGDRLRLDLLHAAADLMATHGSLEGISLRAVAREAGVSPTAVYRHFDDHVTLLRESVELCWHNFHAVMLEAHDSADDPFTAFENAGNTYVRFAMEHQGQYRVLFSNSIDLDIGSTRLPRAMQASADSVDPAESAESAGMSAFQILVDLVEKMLRARGDDRDAFFVAVQVHTWIHGIADLCGNHPGAPWPPVEDLLDGLRHALQLTPRDRAGPV